jgi:hypothetical protein
VIDEVGDSGPGETRGRLAVHAHFYQPMRADPFSGLVPRDPTAAPFHDWNERISAECYRPNLERGNVGHLSFDLGPTLAEWMAADEPETLAAFVSADGGSMGSRPEIGRAMAQGFHHTILPLASAEDRRTEIRWALREFEYRFGRRAIGFWLPETAVDIPTLHLLAEEGLEYTILAPWQAETPELDTRRPYRIDLGAGRSIVVVFYDGALSAAVSFDPTATADADRLARERVAPRLATPLPDGSAPLALVATDGELYGHHQHFRDLFLHRLVAPPADAPMRPFDVVDLATVLTAAGRGALPAARVRERTSWSCHHGIARWTAECPDVADGRWKGPLRSALERLAGGIDTLTEARFAGLPGHPDRLLARDASIDVLVGIEEPDAFATRWLARGATRGDREMFLRHIEAQRWRLAMFASDGWYWDDPTRPETRQILRAAARAVRLVEEAGSAGLEQRLVADLALLRSPSSGRDGAAIYGQSLEDVGQPPPASGRRRSTRVPRPASA